MVAIGAAGPIVIAPTMAVTIRIDTDTVAATLTDIEAVLPSATALVMDTVTAAHTRVEVDMLAAMVAPEDLQVAPGASAEAAQAVLAEDTAVAGTVKLGPDSFD
jgi:hypothetical protein